jgi:autotransporter-associated beta strand protein
VISLKGPIAVLNGDSITNAGTIQGQGRIGSAIANGNSQSTPGTIRADSGQLLLAGLSVNNGVGGTIQSPVGASVVVSNGLVANLGLIALTGGSFDDNGHLLNSSGAISGNGTLSAGTLNNNGTMSFSDGNSNIFGALNNSGGTINTYGTAANIITFFGAAVNSASQSIVGGGSTPAGRIKINGTTVRWLGGLTNNGVYISDPADNYFIGLAVGSSGLVQGGVGDRFFVTSPLTNSGQIDLGGTSQMIVDNGAGMLTQSGGVLEIGASASLSAGKVEIDGGTLLADSTGALVNASLTYNTSAASTYQGILAGTGHALSLNNSGGLLVLTGSSNSYTGGTSVFAGTLDVKSAGAIPDGTALTVGDATAFNAGAPYGSAAAIEPVPEPRSLLTFVAIVMACGLFSFGRRFSFTKS